MNQNLLTQAFKLKDWSQQHRRHLHRYPETSLNEDNTANYCQDVLKQLGYVIKPCSGYGFIADHEVDPNYKMIAFRADMDALAMTEQNNHDFVSKSKHAAHMCGHDTHMAIALTTAYLLQQLRNQLAVNIRFIFQPAEEEPPGGALGMIDKGCLEGVDEVYGLHNTPGIEVGQVGTRVGVLMGAGSRFNITIHGQGAHAARPQDGLDPLVAGSQLVNQFQSMVSRQINPNHPAVVSITQFHAGQTCNVIADQAYLAGTVRAADRLTIQRIEQMMQTYLEGVKLQGYDCHLNIQRGYDAVVNHKVGVDRVVAASQAIIGEYNVDDHIEPQGWAEDFCYYLQHRPGAFYFLGSGNHKQGINQPLHSSRFQVDEDCLSYGAAIMAQIPINAS